jgi:hypothetical protein
MSKHVRVETKNDLTTDAKQALQTALARTGRTELPKDVLTHGLYKFFTIYDAVHLATTQKVLKDSMLMLAKNGRLELDGRSRDALPRQWRDFVQALTRADFATQCKQLVLRMADKFVEPEGKGNELWDELFRTLHHLQAVDVSCVYSFPVMAALRTETLHRFRFQTVDRGPLPYWKFFSTTQAWPALTEWDAPAIALDHDTLVKVVSKKTRALNLSVRGIQPSKSATMWSTLHQARDSIIRLGFDEYLTSWSNDIAAMTRLESLQLHGLSMLAYTLVAALEPLQRLRKLCVPQVIWFNLSPSSWVRHHADFCRQHTQMEILVAMDLVHGERAQTFFAVAKEAKCVSWTSVVSTGQADFQAPTGVSMDFPRLQTLGLVEPSFASSEATWVDLVQEGKEWPRCPKLQMLQIATSDIVADVSLDTAADMVARSLAAIVVPPPLMDYPQLRYLHWGAIAFDTDYFLQLLPRLPQLEVCMLEMTTVRKPKAISADKLTKLMSIPPQLVYFTFDGPVYDVESVQRPPGEMRLQTLHGPQGGYHRVRLRGGLRTRFEPSDFVMHHMLDWS